MPQQNCFVPHMCIMLKTITLKSANFLNLMTMCAAENVNIVLYLVYIVYYINVLYRDDEHIFRG